MAADDGTMGSYPIGAVGRVLRLLPLLTAALLAVPAGASAAPGDLDPTFGVATTPGYGVLPASSSLSPSFAGMAVEADGKLVAAGTVQGGSSTDVLVARFDADGRPDASFGSSAHPGYAAVPVGAGGTNSAAVAIGPSGSIVVVGSTGSPTHVFVVRLTAAGDLDPTFNGGVRLDLSAPAGSLSLFASAVRVTSDGSIVVAGGGLTTSYTTYGYVLRRSASGAVDTSFNGGAPVILSDGAGGHCWAASLALRADDSIVVGGRCGASASTDFAVWELTTAGGAVAGFGSAGVSVFPFTGSASGVAVDAGGDVVLAGQGGTSGADVDLLRLTAAGQYVGITALSVGSSFAVVTSLTMDPVGRALVSGSLANANAFVARFGADGATDATFGTNGMAVLPSGAVAYGATATGGRIVAGGSTVSPSAEAFVVGLLDDTPSPPPAPILTATADPSVPLSSGAGAVVLHATVSGSAVRVVVTQDGRVVYDGAAGDVVDDGLRDATQYDYQAVAYNAAGVASTPTAASATTLDRTAPTAPTIAGGSGSPLRIVLRAPSDAVTVSVRRAGTQTDLSQPTAGEVVDPGARDMAPPAPPDAVSASPSLPGEIVAHWAGSGDVGTVYRYAARDADAGGNASDFTPEAQLTAEADGVRYRVIVDGAVVGETTSTTFAATGVEPGHHAVAVVAVDAAGNASPASAPADVTESPVLGLAAQAGQGFVHSGVAVRFIARTRGGSAPLALVWQFGDGTEARGVTVRHAFRSVGSHTVTLAAIDQFGATARASLVIVVDDTAPIVRVKVVGRVVVVRASDGLAGVHSVRVADGPLAPYFRLDLRRPLLRLSDGLHRLRVRALDRAGNLRRVRVRVTVDTQGPLLRAQIPLAVVGVDAPIAVRATDRLSGVASVTLDGRQLRRDRLVVRAGRPHLVVALDRRGNQTRLALAVPTTMALAALPVDLTYDRAEPVEHGSRLIVLRLVIRRIELLGLLPTRPWGDRYSVPVLRAVETFQRDRMHLSDEANAWGSVGPATAHALDAALGAATRTIDAGRG